jgi:hypothetical protein
MSNDHPGRIATIVAVPVAILTGVGAYLFLKPAPPAPAQTPVTLSASVKTQCPALEGKLPAQIGPEPGPPIMVTCGGPMPTFPPTDFVYGIEGVCWHPDSTGKVWTTVDRGTPVSVTLPQELAGSGSARWVTPLSKPIGLTLPLHSTVPFGCKTT